MSAEELVTPAPAPQNRRALSTAREGYISPRNRTSRQFRLQFAPSRAAGSSGSGGADARTRIAKPNWLRAQAGVPCCEKMPDRLCQDTRSHVRSEEHTSELQSPMYLV